MGLLWVYYHGEVDIAYWEWLLGAAFVIVLYVMFAREKNMMIKENPEYRFYLWGLIAKIIGGAAFGLIYFYYYAGGDTIAYFYSAVSMSRLAMASTGDFFRVWFGPCDWEHLSLFNETIGYPFSYVYFDTRAFFLIRLITPVVAIMGHSYLLTTLALAAISYSGVWRCYRTFVSYFPSLSTQFAIAFLFMPSVVFWGSAIMKDTMTLSAACWWVHCWDEVFFKRRRMTFNIAGLAVSMFLLIMMKPYIFMALFPVTAIWSLFFRVSRIRSALVKVVILPLGLAAMIGGSLYVLVSLGDSLGKFSLDKVVSTVQSTQSDMVRVEAYGANRFDVGTIDGTLGNFLSKFPIATNAALFRPYLWESRSVVMVLSAVENFWLLALTVIMLVRTQVRFFIKSMFGNPIVLMCIVFAILFGFSIGISTPNFGALVRFKIPLVPLYVSGLYIIGYLNKQRIKTNNAGYRFDLKLYTRGEPRSEEGSRGPSDRTKPGRA
jgi:hypothetical protein